MVRDLARRRRQLGALQGQELAGDPGIVAGVLRDEGQPGVVIDVPGQAGRDVVALVRDMVDGRVTVADHAADTVEKAALVIDLAGAVEVDLLVFVTADLGLDLMCAFALRAAADHVEHAAWRGLAVHRRGRAAQHGDAFKVPRLDFGVGERALGQRQAIEELGRIEAAHTQPVGARVGAVAAALYASGVAQGVVEVEHLAIVQLLAGDHSHRARRFDDRRVGLGAGGGAGSDVTAGGAPGAFVAAVGVDRGFRQRQGALGRRHQAVAADAALLQLQAGATQGGLQGTEAVVLAVDWRRSTARDQCRVDGQGNAGLAGNLVEGAGQRCAGQVVGTRGGLLGGEQGRAGQRGGQADGQGHQAGAQDTINSTGHAAAPRRISANCFLAERELQSDRGVGKKSEVFA
ncbi:hypothetical protein D3C81_585840 [compost metagenome]